MVCQHLNVDPNDNYGYKTRSPDRCEGFYVQRIKQHYLNVLSLTWGTFNPNQNDVTDVFITAPGAADKEVFVRAKPIPERIYYRMDGRIPPGGTFTWPINEILPQTDLPITRIGLYGWITLESAGCWAADPDQAVLVPLKISSKKQPLNMTNEALLLRIRVAADTLKVQWRTLPSGEGDASPAITWSEIPGGKNIRAWDTFTIQLPSPTKETMCIEVRAQRLNRKWTRKTLRLQITGLQS